MPPTPDPARRALLLLTVTALAGRPSAAGASSQGLRPTPNRAAGETPSGQPVPRFVSLRSSRVNGRAGPSTDYPVRWVYRREGLPVRVIAETETWRRIEDPDGAVVWVARHNLSSRRTAITRPVRDPQVALRRGASSDAQVLARLADGVIVDIRSQRSGWVEVRAGDLRGWVMAAELWGA